MRRIIGLAGTLVAALCGPLAFAQAQSEAPAAEPIPAQPEASAAEPAESIPAPAAFDNAGGAREEDEDERGWPLHPLDALRGLPRCEPDATPPRQGGIYTCRQPVRPSLVQWSMELDWSLGLVAAPAPVMQSIHALGVNLGFGIGRYLTAGARYEVAGAGMRAPEGGGEPESGLMQRFFATGKLRLFTDEVDRDAWTLSGGLGYALRSDALGGSGGVLRVGLAREVGGYLDDRNALTAALELAYTYALDDSELRTLMASIRAGFELGIIEPLDVDTPDPYAGFHYTVSGDLRLPPFFGLGFTFGLPFGSHLSLRLTADYMMAFGDANNLQGHDGAMFATLGGLRLSASSPERLPLYLEVMAGPGWLTSQNAPMEQLPVVDIETGLRFLAGCSTAVPFGLRLRADVADGFHVRAVTMVMRVEFGHGEGSISGARRAALCSTSEPRRPMAYVPPEVLPEPLPASPPPMTISQPEPERISGGVAVDADVQVEIKPPESIEIDVELGAVLLGGIVQVRIDPRMLPLARLRGAGYVRVELTGPASALGAYQAELGAILNRERISVSAWASTPASDAVIRARFTIWPPGARPPGE